MLFCQYTKPVYFLKCLCTADKIVCWYVQRKIIQKLNSYVSRAQEGAKELHVTNPCQIHSTIKPSPVCSSVISYAQSHLAVLVLVIFTLALVFHFLLFSFPRLIYSPST